MLGPDVLLVLRAQECPRVTLVGHDLAVVSQCFSKRPPTGASGYA